MVAISDDMLNKLTDKEKILKAIGVLSNVRFKLVHGLYGKKYSYNSPQAIWCEIRIYKLQERLRGLNA